MTAPYDPAECERLVREAREDDKRMTSVPWYGRSRFLSRVPDNTGMGATLPTNHIGNVAEPDDASAIARTRNNLSALADQLEAARAEIERAVAALSEVLREDPIRAIGDDRTLPDLIGMAVGDLRQFRAMIDMFRRQLKSTDDAYRAISDGAGGPTALPLWAVFAIRKLHDMVDQTDPNDPIGAALTHAGLERRP